MARALANPVPTSAPRQGVDGRTTIAKARAPLMTDGRIGDMYIDTAEKKLYGPKGPSGWPDNGLIKGDRGWLPVLAAKLDGARRVHQVIDWAGGEGTKPATGAYVGAGGLVSAIGDAVDVRGPQGPEMLISALTAAGSSASYGTQLPVAEEGGENARASLLDIMRPLARLHVPAKSVAMGLEDGVPADIKTLVLDTAADVDGGNGAIYRRVDAVPTGGTYFRTADRFTLSGPADSAHGGYWLLNDIASPLPIRNFIQNRNKQDLRDYDGIDFTGSNDCASIIQTAANQAEDSNPIRYEVPGTITMVSPITVKDGTTFSGLVRPGVRTGTDNGSWFYFAHSGKGFTGGYGGSNKARSVTFKGIGTTRYQDLPAPGWTPRPHDYDFDFRVDDLTLEDVLMLNATKGIRMSGWARLILKNVQGQPFDVGLEIEAAYDTCNVDLVRWWPYWSTSDYVKAYMVDNFTSIYSKRNDNPNFTRCFSIWHKYGVRFGAFAGNDVPGMTAGATSKAKFLGCDWDNGTTPVYVDPGTDGVTATFTECSLQGRDANFTGQPLVHVRGSNCKIDFIGGNLKEGGVSLVRVADGGTGNVVRMLETTTGRWNIAPGATGDALVASAGNAIYVDGKIAQQVDMTVGANVFWPDGPFQSYTPTISASSGAITSYTASARYKIVNRQIEAYYDILLGVAGSANGDMVVSLPAPTSAPGVGFGSETTMTGKGVNVRQGAAGSTFQISFSGDNGSVFNAGGAGDGRHIIAKFVGPI